MARDQNMGCGYCAYDSEWKEVVRELAAANRRRFDESREGVSAAADGVASQ